MTIPAHRPRLVLVTARGPAGIVRQATVPAGQADDLAEQWDTLGGITVVETGPATAEWALDRIATATCL